MNVSVSDTLDWNIESDAVVAAQWKMNRQASVVTFDKQFVKELKNIRAKIYPV